MLFETVRSARRRILANEAVRHTAYALSAALASLILLLLLGTQIFGWPWLLLLPAATLVAGLYITWRHAPSSYEVAQRVDRSLKLADTLSTALFFSAGDRGGDTRLAQRAQAETLAAGRDPRRVVPIRLPRALYGTALLAFVASSMFALRYGLDRRLDLSAPLARIVQDKLGYTEARQAAARALRKPAPQDPKHPGQPGFSLDDSQQKGPGELDAAPDSTLETTGVPDVNKKTASSHSNSKMAQSSPLEGDQGKAEESEGAATNTGNQQSADGRKGPSEGKSGKQGQGDQQQASDNAGESSNLLGKFRDAMSSLMNRMRQQSGSKGAEQQQASKGSPQKSQSGKDGQNAKQGGQPADGQPGDAKDAQPGEDSQNAQSARSGSPGESGQQPAAKQPGSGIGRQDGSKDVKLAEQLAAMGKISEIIGKRAATVTGELTVEVENSNRQLRTPYEQRTAHHGEAGGEINRDEVPVALQAYVQQYFEQVRKQAAPAGTKPSARRRPEPVKPAL